MIPLTLGEIAGIVEGRIEGDPDLVVSGPAFLDSRNPEPGGLFVAFVGEQVDGHEYAESAVEGGAAAVLGSRATGVPTVVVDDTQAALQRLAWRVLRQRRRREQEAGLEDFQVIAITGSSGKTSAKDMLGRVLSDAASTVATAGSFNNELGLPLTVLRLTAETRYLVLEMGARGIGHLAALCQIAPPDVALVLNVGRAHIGEFGSQANIARAKGEIVEAVRPGHGGAVLNADDPLVLAMRERTYAETTTFGHAADADVRLSEVVLDDLGRPAFELTHLGVTEHVELRLLGEHQAINAAAVAAASIACGLELPAVAASLRGIETLSKWRMEVRERPDGLVVVNDAYNANPDSMRAALQTVAGMGERRGRPTVAVLGEMRELGDTAYDEHRAVGVLTHELGFDRVYVVGEGARPIVDGNPDARWFPTREALTHDVLENVRGTDVVLVKASRGIALEHVAEALLSEKSEETL